MYTVQLQDDPTQVKLDSLWEMFRYLNQFRLQGWTLYAIWGTPLQGNCPTVIAGHITPKHILDFIRKRSSGLHIAYAKPVHEGTNLQAGFVRKDVQIVRVPRKILANANAA